MWRVSPLCKRLRGQVAQEFKNSVLQCKIPEIWMITPPTMRRFADYSEVRPRNWSEKRSTDKSALKKKQTILQRKSQHWLSSTSNDNWNSLLLNAQYSIFAKKKKTKQNTSTRSRNTTPTELNSWMLHAVRVGTTSLESNIYDSIRDGAQSTGNLHTCESTINAK